MTIVINQGRQYKLLADISFGFADLTSGVAATLVKLPANSVIHGGRIYCDTAWNSATSDTITVGDAGSAARFIASNATVLRTAALQQEFLATANGYKYTAAALVQITWTGVSTAPTAGAARLYVEYSLDGRSMEAQT